MDANEQTTEADLTRLLHDLLLEKLPPSWIFIKQFDDDGLDIRLADATEFRISVNRIR